ncbi:ABC transporter ATP-binding protein [Caenimonas soli]|uniref:ABC transporter ATP-binding protein n=1 Tax=Caenimonas soli TaxID=2735555 RepID=UPI00155693CC|nr:ABC transporter ATP-binding protein [Caenimonas soli]NPC58332.1 ABC transporter ATP-binding protein [Caenimonas soli]
MKPQHKISIENVSVAFGGDAGGPRVIALDGITAHAQDCEFVALLGPSGCGKSTLLNLVAGFLQPTTGRVVVDGVDVQQPGPERAVVFQDANLFPWLSVAKNVAFGPRVRKAFGEKELREKVEHYLDLVGLGKFANRLPLELSGGMRQRVALARVLINEPRVMLMDEPFGALDAQTRMVMQELLLKIWERQRMTVLFVTHDIDEALLLSDRIYTMSSHPGRMIDELVVPFERPRTYELTMEPEFARLGRQLLDHLHDEARRVATMQ